MTAAACSSQSHPFAAPTFAVVVEDERYRVVDSPRNGGDAEILRHLGELLKQYHSIGEAGVNARLPSCDPWDIPGTFDRCANSLLRPGRPACIIGSEHSRTGRPPGDPAAY